MKLGSPWRIALISRVLQVVCTVNMSTLYTEPHAVSISYQIRPHQSEQCDTHVIFEVDGVAHHEPVFVLDAHVGLTPLVALLDNRIPLVCAL